MMRDIDILKKPGGELAVAIRHIRGRLGLTGMEFGRLYLNCPANTVSEYETAHRRPSAGRLLAILHLAQCQDEVLPIVRALEAEGVGLTLGDIVPADSAFPAGNAAAGQGVGA